MTARWGWCVFFATLLAASDAEAHAFLQRYDLPVPLWLYLTGAAATVALSFVAMIVMAGRAPGLHGYPRFDLLRALPGRILAHPAILFAVQLLSVSIFLLLIAAGLFGAQNAFKNIAPTAVWVIWWVGMAYVSALIGNVWALINPWKIIFQWAEAVYRRVRGRELARGIAYPRRLGVWPAVLLFFVFAWSELVWDKSEVPAIIGLSALIYGAITWFGMWLFGREVWLHHGEAFSVVFGLLARFAPTEFRSTPTKHELNFRPFAVGLLEKQPVPVPMVVFVLLVLSTVTFDGFRETPLWGTVLDSILESQTLRSPLTAIQNATGSLIPILTSLGLLTFPVLFFAVYLLIAALIKILIPQAASSVSAMTMAGIFVLSLVPIAIAYHLSHYLSYLLVAGQFIIPLASDPFGFGWDLFGTTTYRIDIGIVDARFIWFTSIFTIVVGHMLAVYLAHIQATRAFTDARLVRRSQYPMLVLMVAYTMTSLWILAQPVVQDAG